MYRATGSNRRMVRPSSMLAVKLLIIRVRSMQQILDLALFIRQEVLWNSPPEILKLSMVIVLSQVLNSNLVPNCIRSNLRGSKFKIFLGGGGGGGGGEGYYHPATILSPPQFKILYETLLLIMILALELFFCDPQALQCQYLVLYAIC